MNKSQTNGDAFELAGVTLRSRLLLGTGKFPDGETLAAAVAASGAELVTVAFRRVDAAGRRDAIIPHLDRAGVRLLPNTSGARDAREALFVAELAREALETNWLKLEIHPDPKYLMPDPLETLAAAEALVKRGFIVLPYVHADPVLCKRLEEAGCPAVMPLAAPIGSNRGLRARDFLEIIIAQSRVPVIVDAGLGAPSHAAEALELGAAAVLVNTAIATAQDPVGMAGAFMLAVEAGRAAFRAGLPGAGAAMATSPNSPLTGFLASS
jgi:thiazole synthase